MAIDLFSQATQRQAAQTALTTHEHIGFELGWDYAHYRLVPPAPYAQEPSTLRDGLVAGRAAFGSRTLEPSAQVRQWLQLRLNAWLRGRSIELMQITPHYLQQIEATHCPITRVELSATTPGEVSIDRVRNDAGYAAGNLAVMSTKANIAKGAHDHAGALQRVKQIESARLSGISGLNAAQWSRVAVLCSFVEALPHEEACALPLLVLPPNRLRLFNPVQALQAFISRQLLTPGWSHRVSRIEALIPSKPARRAFQTFFHALLPRVLEAGRTTEPQRARWAVEDAWRHPLVLQRWITFAQLMTAQQCETLVVNATARKLGTTCVQQLDMAQATDGWQLESRGYVPHAVMTRRSAPRARRLVGETVPGQQPRPPVQASLL